MHYSVYAGFGLAALFGLVGPAVARRIRPSAGAWLLSAGGLVSAVSGAAVLAVLGALLVMQNPEVADEGHWSTRVLRHVDPVRWPIAVSALTLLSLVLLRLLVATIRRSRALAVARAISRSLGGAGDLTVLPDAAVDAYAVPGRPGRVVVTRGMLRALSRDEGSIVLAHERSHLRHGHHWHRTAVSLAAALNPLLTPLVAAQEWCTERWADEDAAQSCDRAVAAAALGHAAAALEHVTGRPGAALAVHGAAVDRRMAALLAEPPRWRPALIAVAAALVVLSVCATGEAITDAALLLHLAQTAQRHVPLTHLGHRS